MKTMTPYAEKQFKLSEMRALYWKAQAETGCIGRVVLVWDGSTNDRRPMTKDELVKDALETMDRHIQRMAELLDS